MFKFFPTNNMVVVEEVDVESEFGIDKEEELLSLPASVNSNRAAGAVLYKVLEADRHIANYNYKAGDYIIADVSSTREGIILGKKMIFLNANSIYCVVRKNDPTERGNN